MRVNIDEIKEGGLQRSWDVARETVDEFVSGDPAGYRARAGLRIEGEFRKLERRVLFGGRGRAELTAPCGRCLTAVNVDVPLDIEMSFVPAEGGDEGESDEHEVRAGPGSRRMAGSFSGDEVNEESYTGKTIDVDPVVREQVMLALPPYPVCDEGCKGLCSVCGANLNESDCGCDRHVPDPRWAGLEKLRQKAKEE